MSRRTLFQQRLFTWWFGFGLPPLLAGALVIAFTQSTPLGLAACGVFIAWFYETGRTTCSRCAYFGTAKCGLPGLIAPLLTARKPTATLTDARIRSHLHSICGYSCSSTASMRCNRGCCRPRWCGPSACGASPSRRSATTACWCDCANGTPPLAERRSRARSSGGGHPLRPCSAPWFTHSTNLLPGTSRHEARNLPPRPADRSCLHETLGGSRFPEIAGQPRWCTRRSGAASGGICTSTRINALRFPASRRLVLFRLTQEVLCFPISSGAPQ